jgi:hypothetical protein
MEAGWPAEHVFAIHAPLAGKRSHTMKMFIAVLVSAVIVAPFAFAAPRTFVSSSGVDTNPCSRTAPCRSFTAALAQTTPGGTIVVLDSAGYGPVTISQSVSLIAPEGIYAGITANSMSGIEITGTTSNDIVLLQGLSIEGPGTSSVAIYLNNAPIKELYVQRCVISGFNAGIGFTPTNGLAEMTVTDTLIHDCAAGGIEHLSTGHVYVDRCQVINTPIGFWMLAAATATIANTVAERCSTAGILATSGEQVTIEHAVITACGIGIDSIGNAAIAVANSTITDNTTGINTATGGTVLSRIGDATYPIKTNTVMNNGANGSFTGTYPAQ